MDDVNRQRLMSYPKEVLVGYLLDAQCSLRLAYEIDWKRLDFESNQLKSARLIAKAKELLERCKALRGAAWWEAQQELARIEFQLDALNKAQDKLLGIHHDRTPTPTD